MNPVDPLTLQRLIDGECSADEVRSTLAAAELHPELWPTIALALVEDRAWQQRFQHETLKLDLKAESNRFAANGTDQGASTIGRIVAGSPKISDSVSDLKSNSNRAFDVGLAGQHSMFRLNRLALAACALFAALLGYVAGQNFPSASPDSDFLVNTDNTTLGARSLDYQVATAPAATPKITPASLQADYHLQLPSDDRSNLSGDIPLYNVQSLEQWNEISQPTRGQFHLTEEMLADLKARGLRVRQDLKYLSGNLQDGRRFVVPIRTINFSSSQ